MLGNSGNSVNSTRVVFVALSIIRGNGNYAVLVRYIPISKNQRNGRRTKRLPVAVGRHLGRFSSDIGYCDNSRR